MIDNLSLNSVIKLLIFYDLLSYRFSHYSLYDTLKYWQKGIPIPKMTSIDYTTSSFSTETSSIYNSVNIITSSDNKETNPSLGSETLNINDGDDNMQLGNRKSQQLDNEQINNDTDTIDHLIKTEKHHHNHSTIYWGNQNLEHARFIFFSNFPWRDDLPCAGIFLMNLKAGAFLVPYYQLN